MQEYEGPLPIFVVIGIVIILFVQSTLLFVDARKRGQNPWFWGIVGLIQFPFPTIFYLIFVRKVYKNLS